MALADWTTVSTLTHVGSATSKATCISPESTDVVVNSDLKTVDNAGNSVIAPLGLTRSAIKKLHIGQKATSVALRVKYTNGNTITQLPVIQPFGVDANGIPIALKNASGTHELSMSTATTDITDGAGFDYTDEQVVDCMGCRYLIVAVKTSASITGSAFVVARGL